MVKTGEGGIEIKRESRDGGAVAWLVVDHRAKLNIVGSHLIGELCRAMDEIAADTDLRALVLTGAGGRAFIGGADIGEMAGLDPKSARAFITGLHEFCAALRALPLPVIARIEGYCLGAGLEVAAACDLRVATEDAKFAMPEVRVGIPSVIEAALLPRLIGAGKARELILTGAMLSSEQALACGLVERVVPAAELDAAVDTWLTALLAGGREALARQKALIRKWENLPLDEAIEAGIDAFAESYEGDEPVRMMRAFLDRKRC